MGATDSQRQLLSTTTMNRLLLGICWMTKDLLGQEVQTPWVVVYHSSSNEPLEKLPLEWLTNYCNTLESKFQRLLKVASSHEALYFQLSSFTKKTIAFNLHLEPYTAHKTLGKLDFYMYNTVESDLAKSPNFQSLRGKVFPRLISCLNIIKSCIWCSSK